MYGFRLVVLVLSFSVLLAAHNMMWMSHHGGGSLVDEYIRQGWDAKHSMLVCCTGHAMEMGLFNLCRVCSKDKVTLELLLGL